MKIYAKASAPVSHPVVILVRHEGMPHRGMDIVLNSPLSLLVTHCRVSALLWHCAAYNSRICFPSGTAVVPTYQGRLSRPVGVRQKLGL